MAHTTSYIVTCVRLWAREQYQLLLCNNLELSLFVAFLGFKYMVTEVWTSMAPRLIIPILKYRHTLTTCLWRSAHLYLHSLYPDPLRLFRTQLSTSLVQRYIASPTTSYFQKERTAEYGFSPRIFKGHGCGHTNVRFGSMTNTNLHSSIGGTPGYFSRKRMSPDLMPWFLPSVNWKM